MNIPQDKRVRQYELTYLLSAGLTSDELNKADEAVEKLVKKHKGTIISKDDWGKRTLAYTIQVGGKRHTEAMYRFMVVEFDTSHTVIFEKDIFLTQSIIRHLLVIAEATPVKASEAVSTESEA